MSSTHRSHLATSPPHPRHPRPRSPGAPAGGGGYDRETLPGLAPGPGPQGMRFPPPPPLPGGGGGGGMMTAEQLAELERRERKAEKKVSGLPLSALAPQTPATMHVRMCFGQDECGCGPVGWRSPACILSC